MKIDPNLDFGRSIIGSNFGRVGYKTIKGERIWFRQNIKGAWRKLTAKQAENLIYNNLHIFCMGRE